MLSQVTIKKEKGRVDLSENDFRNNQCSRNRKVKTNKSIMTCI